MDTDIDLLVTGTSYTLQPNTFADITPAVYEQILPELLPDGVTIVGTLVLRFKDVELDVEQRERIFRRARLSNNEATLLQQAMAALQANRNDIAQDNGIISDAQTVEATTGTLTAAALSNYVRGLAKAARIQAQNDINTKRELNALIRLVTDRLEAID